MPSEILENISLYCVISLASLANFRLLKAHAVTINNIVVSSLLGAARLYLNIIVGNKLTVCSRKFHDSVAALVSSLFVAVEGALFLFVLLCCQRFESHSCETLRELLDPTSNSTPK